MKNVTYQRGEVAPVPEERILHFAKMNEVWKVCRIETGIFRSAYGHMTFPYSLELDLQYRLGIEVHAPKGTVGILCLPSRNLAEQFANHESSPGFYTAILRCHTLHAPKPITLLFSFWGLGRWLRGEELLRGGTVNDRNTLYPMAGTVVVPSLTPIECVWRSDDG